MSRSRQLNELIKIRLEEKHSPTPNLGLQAQEESLLTVICSKAFYRLPFSSSSSSSSYYYYCEIEYNEMSESIHFVLTEGRAHLDKECKTALEDEVKLKEMTDYYAEVLNEIGNRLDACIKEKEALDKSNQEEKEEENESEEEVDESEKEKIKKNVPLTLLENNVNHLMGLGLTCACLISALDPYIPRLSAELRSLEQGNLLSPKVFNKKKTEIESTCLARNLNSEKFVEMLHEEQRARQIHMLKEKCKDYAKHLGIKDLNKFDPDSGKSEASSIVELEAEEKINPTSLKGRKQIAISLLHSTLLNKVAPYKNSKTLLKNFNEGLTTHTPTLELRQDDAEATGILWLLNYIAKYINKEFPGFFVTGKAAAQKMTSIAAEFKPQPKTSIYGL